MDSSTEELKVWTQTRESSDELKGLLEFPGGKIEPEETPQLAAARELMEETGVKVEATDLALLKIYTPEPGEEAQEKRLNIWAFLLEGGQINHLSKEGWISLTQGWRESYRSKIPPANYEIFDDLVSHFHLKNH